MSQFTDWVANLEAEAKAKLEELGTDAEKVIESVGMFVEQEGEIALEDLGKIALGAVFTQATSVLSGNEKYGTAVTNVIQTVEAQGKTVLLQDAQMAVQAAVKAVQSVGATPAT